MGGPSIRFSRSLVICHIVEFWVETFEQQQRVEMVKFFHSHPVMSVRKTLNGFTGLCVPQTSETFWLAKQMYCMSVPSKDESGSGPEAEAGNHRGSSSGPDFSLQAHPGERRWLGLRTSLAGWVLDKRKWVIFVQGTLILGAIPNMNLASLCFSCFSLLLFKNIWLKSRRSQIWTTLVGSQKSAVL